MNNYERIKAMTLDELFQLLLSFESGDVDYAKICCKICCEQCALNKKSCDCEGCLKWWLELESTNPKGLDYCGVSR